MSVIFGTIKIKHSKAFRLSSTPSALEIHLYIPKFPDMAEEGASRSFRSSESVFLVLINTMLTNWHLNEGGICYMHTVYNVVIYTDIKDS